MLAGTILDISGKCHRIKSLPNQRGSFHKDEPFWLDSASALDMVFVYECQISRRLSVEIKGGRFLLLPLLS